MAGKNHINEIQKSQEHQYDPPYYNGGNLLPFLFLAGKRHPKRAAVFWFAAAVICAIPFSVAIIAGNPILSVLKNIFIWVPFVIFMVMGIRCIRLAKHRKYHYIHHKKKHKHD